LPSVMDGADVHEYRCTFDHKGDVVKCEHLPLA